MLRKMDGAAIVLSMNATKIRAAPLEIVQAETPVWNRNILDARKTGDAPRTARSGGLKTEPTRSSRSPCPSAAEVVSVHIGQQKTGQYHPLETFRRLAKATHGH